MALYSYIRVSTKEQHTDRQEDAIAEFNIPPENVFIDKASGKNFNRPAYRAMLEQLAPGDVLILKSIDRLGRNYDDIKEQWRILTHEKQVDIKVLDMELLDTRANHDGVVGKLISDIVLQLLAYVAEQERKNIRSRQAEGIASAKARGVRFGRPRKERSGAFYELMEQWKQKQINSRKAGERLGIAHVTFLEWVREEEAKENRDAESDRTAADS